MQQILQSDQPGLHTYQPGNMTRYRIFAERFSGYVAFMWLKLNDRGGHGMIVVGHEMDLGYFQEKSGVTNEPDAVALCCFLWERFGIEVSGIPDEYRRERWFQSWLTRMGLPLEQEVAS